MLFQFLNFLNLFFPAMCMVWPISCGINTIWPSKVRHFSIFTIGSKYRKRPHKICGTQPCWTQKDSPKKALQTLFYHVQSYLSIKQEKKLMGTRWQTFLTFATFQGGQNWQKLNPLKRGVNIAKIQNPFVWGVFRTKSPQKGKKTKIVCVLTNPLCALAFFRTGACAPS